MNNKTKALSVIGVGITSLTLLVSFSASNIGQEHAPAPDIRPVSTFTQGNRATPPPKHDTALVAEESAAITVKITPPTEIAFEHHSPQSNTAFVASSEPPMGKPTPTPTNPQNSQSQVPAEPKMGDTRIVDGQQQVYFLGFGWIESSDEPNIGIVVDGDGDINKMVGTM